MSIVTTSVRDQLDNNQLIKEASRYITDSSKLTLLQADLLLPIVIALKDPASPIYKYNGTSEYEQALSKALSRVSDKINTTVVKSKSVKLVKQKDDRPKLEQLTKVDTFIDDILRSKPVSYPVFDFTVVTKAEVIQVVLEHIHSLKTDFETIRSAELEIDNREDKTGQGDYYMCYDKQTVDSTIDHLTKLIKSFQDVDVSSTEYKKLVKESKQKTPLKLTKKVIKESKKLPSISSNSKFSKNSIVTSKVVALSRESEPHLIFVLKSLDGSPIKMKSAKRTETVFVQQFRIKSANDSTDWKTVIESANTKTRQSPFTISDDILIHYVA
jgi:hypothetical protein